MNWKPYFIGSLILSTLLIGVYFSLEWTTIETLGGWNGAIMLAIIGLPSFTFFSWIFQAAEHDPEFEKYSEGFLKSVYHSFLGQLSENPEDREILNSVYESGKNYYTHCETPNWENRIKEDIEKNITSENKAA